MDFLIQELSLIIHRFFISHGCEISLYFIKVSLTLISSTGVLAGLLKFCSHLIKKRKNRRLLRDLHPYFTLSDIEKATNFFIETKCQNIPPSREQEPRQTHAFVTKQKLIPFFIESVFQNKNEDQRFYIILADSGMGKTTFMLNLYQRYVNKLWGKSYDIVLLPLGASSVDQDLDKINDENKANTILLLDAFDEDVMAVLDYRKRMEEIVSKVWRFRKVVITCRTQFFPFEEEEPAEIKIKKYANDGGFHSFLKLYVSPFDDRDISKYLSKKFSIFKWKRRKLAKKIIESSPDLMVRPMLLNYVDDLLEYNFKFVYSYQIYERLIEKWIDREANRKEVIVRKRFKEELYKFSEEVALEIFLQFKRIATLHINGGSIANFAKSHGIELDSMEMKSRSLLNRDSDGHFKFSHKSILEYLIALRAFKNKDFNEVVDFTGMSQAINFYRDLCFSNYTLPLINDRKVTIEAYYRLGISSNWTRVDWRNFNRKEASLIEKVKVVSLNEDTFKLLSGFPNIVILEANHIELTDKQINCLDFKILYNLRELHINHNRLNTISSLKHLRKLEILDLSNNSINDISSLSSLTRLKHLKLENNNINFIDSLSFLYELESLDLSGNHIMKLTPLTRLRELKILGLKRNELELDTLLKLRGELKKCDIDSEETFELLINESQSYPSNAFKSIKNIRNSIGQNVNVFQYSSEEFMLLGLFNQITVNVINNGELKNIIYSNSMLPDDLYKLKKLIDIVYKKYGSDDLGMRSFDKKELDEIKQGKWVGRHWHNSVINSNPIQISVNEKKEIELIIFGLK